MLHIEFESSLQFNFTKPLRFVQCLCRQRAGYMRKKRKEAKTELGWVFCLSRHVSTQGTSYTESLPQLPATFFYHWFGFCIKFYEKMDPISFWKKIKLNIIFSHLNITALIFNKQEELTVLLYEHIIKIFI